MKYKITIIYLLVSFFITATNVTAKDVSNEITVGSSGLILGCMTRLGMYSEESKNLYEIPDQKTDPDAQKIMVRNALQISIPYFENIRNAAWSLYPGEDWDEFYSLQVEQVNLFYQTNNVFFDTMSCVLDLMKHGVMYPRFTDEMPPEQEEIMMQQIQEQMQRMQQ